MRIGKILDFMNYLLRASMVLSMIKLYLSQRLLSIAPSALFLLTACIFDVADILTG